VVLHLPQALLFKIKLILKSKYNAEVSHVMLQCNSVPVWGPFIQKPPTMAFKSFDNTG
jgi:hypothetical protein